MNALSRATTIAITVVASARMLLARGIYRRHTPLTDPRRRTRRRAVLLIAALLPVVGCAPPAPPELTMLPDASLSGIKMLGVAPASNDTGQTYELDIGAIFTDDLTSALRSKGYTVIEPNSAPPDAVIVQCSFVSYAPGNAFQRWLVPGLGPTQATVKTSLIDKKSGHILGGMVTGEEVASGGLLSAGAYKFILQRVADEVAGAIDRQIKGN